MSYFDFDSASVAFICFGLLAVVVANGLNARAWRFWTLLLFSLIFVLLLAPGPIALVPLAGFLAAGYLGVVAVRSGGRRSTTIAVVLIVAVYAWLKEYSFLPHEAFIPWAYLQLGLSYIFFRILHVIIDARDSQPIREMGLARYLAYTLNFTTFVSGPIQRYEDFEEQIGRLAPCRPDLSTIATQVERLVIGFFKVNVLGLLFNMVHVDALTQLSVAANPSGQIWAGLKAIGSYPFFLYCNFSGYIDIVIALAGLMGLKLPENFNHPFSATSFIDFWNRWHITLSAWLKSYVYNPLLLAILRRSRTRTFQNAAGILCSFVTFFLIGIWHGRTSEFVIFGLLQGTGIAVNKIWQNELTRLLGHSRYRSVSVSTPYAAAARGLTFAWFAFSAIWFWGNWPEIARAFTNLGYFRWVETLLLLWLISVVVLSLWEVARDIFIEIASVFQSETKNYVLRTVMFSAVATISFIMTFVLSQPAPGIIYRTF